MIRKVSYAITAALTVAAIAAELLHAPVLLLFALTSLALVGLAWLLGEATESVGHHAGPRVSGVLNATFGNAAELIITIFALSAGLTGVVKASIIGSVIGNVLLVLGASILLGGLKNGTQRFSTTIAGANAAMLAIIVFALAFPTVFATLDPAEGGAWSTEYLSLSVAAVLLVLYILYLLFYLRRQGQPGGEERPPFGKMASFALLLGTTAAVAYVSEAFVGAIEPLVSEIGVSELFIGVILVPIIGNIAEHVVGVQIA